MKKKDVLIALTDQQLSKLQKSSEQPEGGHFVTGFVVGGLVGALGYFMLGTKKGHKKLGELQKEWEKYEPNVVEKAKEFKLESLFDELKKVVKYLEMKGK